MSCFPEFLHRLKASRTARMSVGECLRLFRDSVPDHDRNGDMGAALFMQELNALSEEGEIRFGKQNKTWTSVGRIPAPRQITVTREKKPASTRPVVEWDARIAPLAVRRTAEQLDDLMLIDGFLKKHALSPFPVIPARARSLTIFGDEKKLERYRSRDWRGYFEGALTAGDLATFTPVEIYFAHSVCGLAESDRILLVENQETFYMAKAWNSERRRYRAVAFGSGGTIHASVPALGMLLRDTGSAGFDYFGDIDEPGFAIPLVALSKYRQITSEPLSMMPATDLYRRCLDAGIPAAVTNSRDDAVRKWRGSTAAKTKEWLADDDVFCLIDDVITSGQRLAQEWVFTFETQI